MQKSLCFTDNHATSLQKTFNRAINNGLLTTSSNKGDLWGMAYEWQQDQLHVFQTVAHLWRLASHVVLQMCEYCLFSGHVRFYGPADLFQASEGFCCVEMLTFWVYIYVCEDSFYPATTSVRLEIAG